MGIWIAVLLMLLAMPAGAQEWRKYSSSTQGDRYFDVRSVRAIGHMRRVWTVLDLSKRGPIGELSLRSLNEVDCKEQRARMLALTTFSESMARGDVLFSASGSTSEPWEFLAPGTVGEDLLQAVCPERKLTFYPLEPERRGAE